MSKDLIDKVFTFHYYLVNPERYRVNVSSPHTKRDLQMNDNKNEEKNSNNIAIGLCLGMLIGLAFDQLALGMIFGLLFGSLTSLKKDK